MGKGGSGHTEVLTTYEELCAKFPPRKGDGSPNPEYFREMYRQVNRSMMDSVLAGGAIPFNADAARKNIDAEAAAAGFNPAILADTRTPEEKALEAARLLNTAPEEALEQFDEVLEVLERTMDDADRLAGEYIDENIAKHNRDHPDPKGWRHRIRRIRCLRERARRPIPRTTPQAESSRLAAEAAHVLRFMVYVGRSNMPKSGRSPAEYIFQIGAHHVKMAVDLWQFEAHAAYTYKGVEKGKVPYRGIVLTCPPGHGKTEFIVHWAALEMEKNRRTQGVMLHAQKEGAEANLAYLANCLDRATDVGRRYLSLFPDMKVERKNTKILKIAGKFTLKEPTWQASGDMSKRLGKNTNVIIADDTVPQSDAEQETERTRRFDRFNGTWLTRQRGKGASTKLIVIGNVWHHDDMHSRLIYQAERCAATAGREGVLMRVSKQRVGGPRTTPRFFSIWPDVYPPEELKARYTQMQNPRLWAAAYELNPAPDDVRVVRKLRLYNPRSAEHKDFLAGAVKRLSIDPAGTRNQKSDKAGVLYIAQGLLRESTVDERGRTFTTEPRLRLCGGWQVSANQVDIVQWSMDMMKKISVDYLHVESRSGYAATGDIFEHYHGVPVIRYDPKNKDKKERLRAVAPMLEDCYQNTGLRACVEFPCEVDGDGNPVLDADGQMQTAEDAKWLARQVLDFGFVGDDHGVDALTQVLIDQMSDMDLGAGRLTRLVRQTTMTQEQERMETEMKALRAELRGEHEEGPASAVWDVVNSWNN